jgi:undecaprenyl-diphosphatase
MVLSSYFGIQEDDFVKLFQVSINLDHIGGCCTVLEEIFRFLYKNVAIYIKLICAVIPALVLGKLFDDKIEAFLAILFYIAVLILGGVIY